jgi:hypothetical protein
MAYDYMLKPCGRAIMEVPKRHFWKRKDELQDRITDIDSVLMVTMPGTEKYTTLLKQREQIEEIRKKKKEIKILGMEPKDILKGVLAFVGGFGIYAVGQMMEYENPKIMKLSRDVNDNSSRLWRDI